MSHSAHLSNQNIYKCYVKFDIHGDVMKLIARLNFHYQGETNSRGCMGQELVKSLVENMKTGHDQV